MDIKDEQAAFAFANEQVAQAKEILKRDRRLKPRGWLFFKYPPHMDQAGSHPYGEVEVPYVYPFFEEQVDRRGLPSYIAEAYHLTRAISTGPELIAVVVVSDAWLAEELSPAAPSPSQSPNRMEAISVFVHFADKKFCYYHVYERPGGKISFLPGDPLGGEQKNSEEARLNDLFPKL